MNATVRASAARRQHAPRRLISYFRFSDRRQGKGTSIERQIEGARKYAVDHGLIFDETLSMRDLGKSACKGKHIEAGSEFGAFLVAIKDEKVAPNTTLYVESLDRLSRQRVLLSMSQLTMIIEAGIPCGHGCRPAGIQPRDDRAEPRHPVHGSGHHDAIEQRVRTEKPARR